ncbi:hypothetical protein AVT43_gp77 [Polaribacter phage P12002L]|uniref:Uncharacterized protein n=2 Tax=Incheonvirus TaxID=2976977 RepID=A0A0F7INE3_9CAUD|nr:hypothetical protein AVT42_gp79 [Polaribacter phage P12002S]YP_009209737.1 hypothetical protein AVT43_gp77 [Polaribacter phage P12002L]AKG94251.1 hypothetical protein P12002L_0077 [Polaribacter phage P12002L]AKG94335.1 hypothetical protein P12002S_0079 [Polaribacter phage P12002S]
MEFLKKEDIKIGVKFLSSGKHKRLCTVIDILKTYNHKNELVKTTYIEQHDFCGQTLKSEVSAVSVQIGNFEYLKTLK